MLFLLPGNDDANSPLDRAIAGFRDRYTVPVFSPAARCSRAGPTRPTGGSSLCPRTSTACSATPASPATARASPSPRAASPGASSRSDPPTLLTYEITGDCPVGGGKGVVEAAWLDGAGRSLTNDTRFVTCRNDGAAVAGSFFAPLGAHGLVLYVGSAGDKPFALSAFAPSRR